ncbi:hypothetical protein HMPREF0454_04092 [Hafnia alvei ATCC 51873]|uniref:Uncharacterized protein n=1 Tax=Hafnia alvei ATCC 51873 TaxID=1002364 RepID=G9YBR3_HAFAL|nr:hypothetical protein HMPREF0454_04092 [Hafnia alvei ATCC 51873]
MYRFFTGCQKLDGLSFIDKCITTDRIAKGISKNEKHQLG